MKVRRGAPRVRSRRALVRVKERVQGYDLARAVAILAMVLINFQVYLLESPDGLALDVPSRWLSHLPSGRSSALFVTLAGAGISLMNRSPDRGKVRKTLLLRSLFLLVSGNLLILVWRIDILHFYAFYLALAALVFLRFSDRELLGAAVTLAAFGGLLAVAFDWGDTEYWSLRGMPIDIFVDGIHPVVPWIAFVLVGMWVGRRDLRDPGTRRRLMLGGALVATAAELAGQGFEALAPMRSWPPDLTAIGTTGWSPDPLYVVAASGTSVLAIAACQEIVSRFGERLVVRALISTGQVSLSIYILHALVGVGVPRWLLGLEDATGWLRLMGWWALFCVLAVCSAHLWRRRFSRGPLEWAMRKLCGDTPPAPPPAPARETSSPPRWPWIAVAAAVVAVGAFRVVGIVSPSWGCGDDIPLETRVVSELTLTCPRRGFSLDVEEPAELTFETESGRDFFLELWGETKRIGADDDSGLALNPRLTRHLRAGHYRVVIRPYDAGLGPFALTVSR